MARLTGVRPSGAGIQIRWQSGGKVYSRFINRAPTETNLQDAARLRRKLIEESALSGTVYKLTFENACKRFLKDIAATRSPSTVLAYRKRLEAHWSSLGPMDVKELTLPVLRQADREQEWKSQKTRRDCQSVLAGVLQWCVKEGVLEANPARALVSGRWQRPEIDPFTDDEIRSIFSELRGQPALLYRLMLETGMRTGEACALQWGDVEETCLRVQATIWEGERKSTKTHQARKVALTSSAIALLKGHTETRFAGMWVFTTIKGNAYSEEHLTDAFRTACERAGVRYRRPYTLRHTFASKALSAGVEVAWLAQQLGDRVETVLRHYARWIGSAERDARELAKLEVMI